MRAARFQYIFIIFIIMVFMTACRSKDDNSRGDTELPKEIETKLDNNSTDIFDSAEVFPVFDVDSVLYENAIQNKEPIVDLFFNENIYAFYGEQIKVFDYNTKTELQTILLEGLENVRVLAINNELNLTSDENVPTESESNTYVTAFTLYNKEYYVISDTTENTKSITKILRFDSSGKLIHEYPIQIDNLAEKIVIKDDKVIILSINAASIQEPLPYYDLTIYNLIDQKQSKVDINKVLAVTITDNGKAAIARIGEDGQNILQLMDMETQQIEKEVNLDINFIMDLDYHNNELYILTVSDVYTIDYDLSTPVASLLNNYIKDTSNRKIRIHEDKLVILHNSNHLLLYDHKSIEQKAIDSEPYTLTILTSYNADVINYLFGDYINELKMKYPNIKLEILDVTDMNETIFDYDEKIAKKLMAKDTDFDLFIMFDNDNLIKSEYYEDLSKYKQISSNLDEMLPGIKNLMSYNNKIYGVPIAITFSGLRYNTDEFDRMNMKAPDNQWTISDFYNFAMENKVTIEKETKPLLHYNHVLTLDNMINSSFYVSYLQGVELSSEDLTSNFEMLKELVDEKLITIDLNYKGKAIIADTYINALLETETHLTPIIPKEGCEYLTNISYISLNPSSPNKELAVEFLTAFTDSEIRKKSIYQNIAIYMQYDSDLENVEASGIFHYYSELDRFKSHLLYRKLLENSVRNISFEGRAEIGYLFEEYMNGKRTAKSAADEIMQRLDMIKYE